MSNESLNARNINALNETLKDIKKQNEQLINRINNTERQLIMLSQKVETVEQTFRAISSLNNRGATSRNGN